MKVVREPPVAHPAFAPASGGEMEIKRMAHEIRKDDFLALALRGGLTSAQERLV